VLAFHPRLMFNGEGDCVATKLRPRNVQCRGLGRTVAQSGPRGGSDMGVNPAKRATVAS
jgi:hypothetical protein